jgi:hypothetical protein
MKFFLKTALPILLGVVLWNLMPGTASKLIVLGVATVVILVPILRGKYGGHDTPRRVTSLLLTVAILSASTLPAATQRTDWAPQGEDVAQVQRAEMGCSFWCMLAWGLVGGAAYDALKWGIRWWIDNEWGEQDWFQYCVEDDTCLEAPVESLCLVSGPGC